MKEQKIRFTVWLNPAVLGAAKVRANRDGVSVSEVLARAARRELGQDGSGNPDEQIRKAVDRVFFLVQRADKRRGFEHQVLKEMLGLAVLAFFNHTPPVPDADQKIAQVSGNARFQQFLDAVATNLRRGRSVLAELLQANDDSPPANSQANEVSHSGCTNMPAEDDAKPPVQIHPQPADSEPQLERQHPPLRRRTQPVTMSPERPKRWSLFG